MISIPTFNAILEAIDQLSPDEQAELIDVVRRRINALRRSQIFAEVREAEDELHASPAAPRTAGDVMNDIVS